MLRGSEETLSLLTLPLPSPQISSSSGSFFLLLTLTFPALYTDMVKRPLMFHLIKQALHFLCNLSDYQIFFTTKKKQTKNIKERKTDKNYNILVLSNAHGKC